MDAAGWKKFAREQIVVLVKPKRLDIECKECRTLNNGNLG
jgi:hypothetical protein